MGYRVYSAADVHDGQQTPAQTGRPLLEQIGR
jgi:hypothetical protein